MGRVRQHDTSAETTLGSALWNRGLRYRKQRRVEGTRPDFVFVGGRVAVFVDGCFWHGCPRHYTAPVANADFWKQKLATNQNRDAADGDRLKKAGWTVLRYWECEVESDPNAISTEIAAQMERKE